MNDHDLKAIDIRIGANIRNRRVELGLTQQALAGQIGVSYQQIQKYETGANRVSAARLLDLAAALDSTFADLIADGAVVPAAEEHGGKRRAEIIIANLARQAPADVRSAVIGLLKAIVGDDAEATRPS